MKHDAVAAASLRIEALQPGRIVIGQAAELECLGALPASAPNVSSSARAGEAPSLATASPSAWSEANRFTSAKGGLWLKTSSGQMRSGVRLPQAR